MTNVAASRAEQLTDWLAEVGARPIASVDGPNDSELTFYAVAGTVIIVQKYHPLNMSGGFELYVPPTRSGEIAKTFAAASRALEVR